MQAINPGLPTEGWISVTLLSHRVLQTPGKVIHGLWVEGSSCLPMQTTDLWMDGGDVVWPKTVP